MSRSLEALGLGLRDGGILYRGHAMMPSPLVDLRCRVIVFSLTRQLTSILGFLGGRGVAKDDVRNNKFLDVTSRSSWKVEIPRRRNLKWSSAP